MKIIQLPHDSKNPYLKILREKLSNRSIVTVEGVSGRSFILFRSVFKHWKPDMIHLHWHHNYLLAHSAARTRIKSLVFLFEVFVRFR